MDGGFFGGVRYVWTDNQVAAGIPLQGVRVCLDENVTRRKAQKTSRGTRAHALERFNSITFFLF